MKKGYSAHPRTPGPGLPDRLLDVSRLRLDFMPYEERTVQPYGIALDGIRYYDDVLRAWINATDPEDASGKRKRKFIVRRDPRDISMVYFFDPEVQQYFSIPYRNTGHPPMSIWELRETRRQLKMEGQKAVNEDLIFSAYNRLRALESEAVQETKKARRSAQRRRRYEQIERPVGGETAEPPDVAVENLDDIQPFDEIEELDV
jgi:putative transposase